MNMKIEFLQDYIKNTILDKITVVYRSDDSDESHEPAEGDEKSKDKRKDLKQFMLEKIEDENDKVKKRFMAIDKKFNRFEELMKTINTVKTPEQKQQENDNMGVILEEIELQRQTFESELKLNIAE